MAGGGGSRAGLWPRSSGKWDHVTEAVKKLTGDALCLQPWQWVNQARLVRHPGDRAPPSTDSTGGKVMDPSKKCHS